MARGNELERVRSIVLVYENLAAGDGLSDDQPLELGKVLRRQVAEGFDQRQRGCPSGTSRLRRLSVAHGRPSLTDCRLRLEERGSASDRERQVKAEMRSRRPTGPLASNHVKSWQSARYLRRERKHLLDVVPVDEIVEPGLEIF